MSAETTPPPPNSATQPDAAPAPAPVVAGDLFELDENLAQPRGVEVIAALEALLFATTEPRTVAQLGALMNGVSDADVRAGLDQLRSRYEAPGCGLSVIEVAGGFVLATKPEVADWVLRLHRHRKKAGLSPALMETLSIVAYKQPLTKAEIEAIRGVDCGAVLRALQEADLIEVVGRREVAGRPSLYGTTTGFLKVFGLPSLDDLPSLADLRTALANAPSAAAAPPAADAPAGGA